MVTMFMKYKFFFLRGAFVIFLLLGAWFMENNVGDVAPVPIKKALSGFPQQIGEYRFSNSLQSSAGVVELLGVNDYIQYNYVSSAGDNINLYVGYYRAVGVDGTYHSPKNCLPGGGWGIDSVKDAELAAGTGGEKSSVVSNMTIRNGGSFQVVFYWFQNRGRIIGSEYWEKIYLIWDALTKGRRDGAFVRIISMVDGDGISAAEQRVAAFAEMVIPELEQFLPGEFL